MSLLSKIGPVLLGWSSALSGPEPGQAPPAITLEEVLQAPAGARSSWEALEGKVVVLEFWATWCGPCVAAIPHLNELSDKYKDKPVQFISITDEPREKVETFLKKRPIKAWVGLDTDRSMLKAYGVTGIPHTVIVAPDGRIAAITYPTNVTGTVLDVLAGKPAGIPEVPKRGGAAAEEGPPPLFEVVIRPAPGDSAGMSTSPTHRMYRGQPLGTIIAGLMDTRPTRVIGDDLPSGRFDARATVAEGEPGEAARVLLRAVEMTFGLSLDRETREVDVLVLTLPGGAEKRGKGLSPTASTGGTSMSWGGGMIHAVNYDLNGLSITLEDFVGRPVVDESGIKDRFDIDLDIEGDGVEAVTEAVREQLGVELKPARRPVEVVVAKRRART